MESKYISPGPEALWVLLSHVKWYSTPDNWVLLTNMPKKELVAIKDILTSHYPEAFLNGVSRDLWLDLFNFELNRRTNQAKAEEIESKISKAIAEIEAYQAQLKELRGS